MYLAEINIARLLAPKGDPKVAPFMDAVDAVNLVAERSDGFVWRFTKDAPFSDDPKIIATMSVWRDLASFENFVWNTVHKRFFERKHEWFEILGSQHFVMWMVEKGHEPTLNEAREKLAHFDQHGASDLSFDWKWIKARG